MEEKNRLQIIKWLAFLFFASFLIALANRFFINLAGAFAPGLAGLAQGIVYTTWNIFSDGTKLLGMNYSQFVNTFYSIIYWILNIPIIIFSFKKLGMRFSLSSLFVLFSSLIMTILLANLPFLSGVFSGEELQALKNSDKQFAEIIEYLIFPAIGFIGGLCYGVSCGLIYKTGSSTMGMDPVSKYLEQEKGINLNVSLFMISLVNSLFWIIIISCTSGEVTSLSTFISATLLSPMMFTTIIFLCGYLLASNKVYPSLKRVMLEVYSTKERELTDYLISNNIIKTATIKKSESGYMKKEFGTVNIIVYDNELENIIKKISEIDSAALLTITKLEKVLELNKWG